jgi:tetratricopeptide (TPR) repeat protein
MAFKYFPPHVLVLMLLVAFVVPIQSQQQSGASSTQPGAGTYSCAVPTCQKEIFDIAMKDIARDPNNAEAYFVLAQAMCPKINLLPMGQTLEGGKLVCPQGTAEALNKYLELAPNGRLAGLVKKRLSQLSPLVGPPSDNHNVSTETLFPSQSTSAIQSTDGTPTTQPQRLSAAESYVSKGMALVLANKVDEALDAFTMAITTDPNEPTAYFGLGTGLVAKAASQGGSGMADASVAFNKYLQLAPTGFFAEDAKKSLAVIHAWVDSHAGDATGRVSVASQASSATNDAGAMQAKHRQVPPGMLDGVYVGLGFSGYGYHVEHEFMVFSPDGSVLGDLPEGGLAGVNLAAFARNQPDKSLLGQYHVSGNRIDIVWQDSHNQSVTFDDTSADVTGLHNFIPACHCDGAKFSGVYTWDKYALQFSPDGTFNDYGAVDAVLTSTEHPRPGHGTYKIQDNTLFLSYVDGRQLRKSFAAPAVEEGRQSFRWIAISNITLNEQHYESTH